jgi:hypothetical protein
MKWQVHASAKPLDIGLWLLCGTLEKKNESFYRGDFDCSTFFFSSGDTD